MEVKSERVERFHNSRTTWNVPIRCSGSKEVFWKAWHFVMYLVRRHKNESSPAYEGVMAQQPLILGYIYNYMYIHVYKYICIHMYILI